MARYSGSGWHNQSIRHSNARKYGKAGGTYAKRYVLIGRSQGQTRILGSFKKRIDAETKENLMAFEPTDEKVEYKIKEYTPKRKAGWYDIGHKNYGKKQIPIMIFQNKKSPKQDNSFWYEGVIAEGENKKYGTKFRLVAVGDIAIYNKKGELVYDNKPRGEGITIKNDDDLDKIGYEYTDKYRWENNNWFEIEYKLKGTNVWESFLGGAMYSYDEAIKSIAEALNLKYTPL